MIGLVNFDVCHVCLKQRRVLCFSIFPLCSKQITRFEGLPGFNLAMR